MLQILEGWPRGEVRTTVGDDDSMRGERDGNAGAEHHL